MRLKVTQNQGNQENLTIRLCHVCSAWNESEHEIIYCDQCGSSLTIEKFINRFRRLQNKQWDSQLENQENPGDGEIQEFGIRGLVVKW